QTTGFRLRTAGDRLRAAGRRIRPKDYKSRTPLPAQARRRAQVTRARLHEEAVCDEGINHTVAIGNTEVPEAPDLRTCEAHSWHLVELATNDLDGVIARGWWQQESWRRCNGRSAGHREPPMCCSG